MFVEYELVGSKMVHKGIFETTGFWCKFEEQRESFVDGQGKHHQLEIEGYKIYSHSGFSFYHEDEETVNKVYDGLCWVLSGGSGFEDSDIGYIQGI